MSAIVKLHFVMYIAYLVHELTHKAAHDIQAHIDIKCVHELFAILHELFAKYHELFAKVRELGGNYFCKVTYNTLSPVHRL